MSEVNKVEKTIWSFNTTIFPSLLTGNAVTSIKAIREYLRDKGIECGIADAKDILTSLELTGAPVFLQGKITADLVVPIASESDLVLNWSAKFQNEFALNTKLPDNFCIWIDSDKTYIRNTNTSTPYLISFQSTHVKVPSVAIIRELNPNL